MRRIPIPALPLICLLAAGCTSEAPEGKGKEACVSTEKFFQDRVWQPFMGSQCQACHSPQGTARESNFVLHGPAQPDYLRANLEAVARMARWQVNGRSIMLLKPIGGEAHGGGVQIEEGGKEYKALAELLDRLQNPIECEKVGDGLYGGLELLSPEQTLRKASLSLVGRLPTDDEIARVQAGGEESLSEILDEMMTEEVFFDRVKETYNDLFLTDRYLNWEDAINLLDSNDYPNRRWYEATEDEALRGEQRAHANRAVAREPLELVAHVVREHRPFTEILTADYRWVNPYSAKSFGFDVSFQDETDPDEWKEVRISEQETAGVLTTVTFLNRFPTTATNRNRARARMVYRFFLATDLLKLADRPVDPTNIDDFNPTMNNAECTVCHEPMDPVAGTFQNWDARGRYRPPENGWYADMRPPGYGEERAPHADRAKSLEWLASRIAEDKLFVTATVHTVYTMMTGQTPLSPPVDPAEPGYADMQAAYDAQVEFFREAGNRFISDGYDFKSLVKSIVLSPNFRASGVPASGKVKGGWVDVGTAQLLTPEQLDRKIEATTGYPWKQSANGRSYLLHRDEYLIFYGGMDSSSVTTRIFEPSGVMASVQARMANEMACRSVSRDFSLDSADRRLFPAVERGYVPEDENGFEIPGAVEAIKENIRYLHERLLGEELLPGDPEIQRTYELFYETWKEGREGIADQTLSTNLPWWCSSTSNFWTGEELPEERRITRDADYTVRAWMAVVSYLLSDYRFLYE